MCLNRQETALRPWKPSVDRSWTQLPCCSLIYRSQVQHVILARGGCGDRFHVWQVRTFSKAHRDGPLRSHERLASSQSKKAIEQCDVMPPSAFMDTLAMLLSQKNDYVRALEWQQKAVALQPESLVYRLNLAKIYIKGGKKDLARKELDALAARGDKFSAQAEVTSLLKNL